MKIDLVALGRRIRGARIAAGIRSQEALADRVGITREAANRIETGKVTPEVETIVAIAKACGVSESYLLGTEEVGLVDAARLAREFKSSSEALLLSPPATDEEIQAAAHELQGGVWARVEAGPQAVALTILAIRSGKKAPSSR